MRSLCSCVVVGFCFLFSSIVCKAVHPGGSSNHSALPLDSNPIAKQLQEVFGLPNHHRQRQLLSPPPYMLSLYATVADDNGLVKAENPYGAKIIRSHSEKVVETIRRNRFTFTVSGMGSSETLLEAELHLYLSKYESTHPFEIRIYQIPESNSTNESFQTNHRLINVRHVDSGNSVDGWQTFRVTQALDDLNEKRMTQVTFLLATVTATGQSVQLHISRRRDWRSNRQPVLVLFNDDGTSLPSSLTDQVFSQPKSDPSASYESERMWISQKNQFTFRQRRDLTSLNQKDDHLRHKVLSHHQHRRHSVHHDECHRQQLFVDFETIGWSEWIIAPKGYNAFYCTGTCSFPLGQNQKPTNHATVQSIVHELNLAESVGQPCCVPSRLLSLSLLYYDENDNVVLKQYGEMVADSCGCH